MEWMDEMDSRGDKCNEARTEANQSVLGGSGDA